jgi:hypothetical protein
MVEKGSTVGHADILGVFELFRTVLCAMMGEGVNVNTPFANFRTSIKGNFTGIEDVFDRSRHQIVPSASTGKKLKEYFRHHVSTTKIDTRDMNPVLNQYTDYASGKINSTITPGKMARIVGARLKIERTDSDQGLFFIGEDGRETKVDIIGENFPTKLMFSNPDSLPPGGYKLAVRTGPGIMGILKETIRVPDNEH